MEILSKRSFDFPPPQKEGCDVLIIAGEHSGDEQAARMLRGALRKNPDLKVCAFGGRKLEEAGARLLFDMTGFSVVGLMEVLENYGFFKALHSAIAEWIKKYSPKSVCFVDYPGFNLSLANELRKMGVSRKGGGSVKLLYYISPQIWAWKSGRRFKMEKNLDALGVIFPFEKACFADTSLPVSFVGHPFMSDEFLPSVEYSADAPVLLLSGSRPKAVGRIFPAMLEAFRLSGADRAAALYPTKEIGKILEDSLKKYPDLSQRVKLIPRGQEKIFAKAVLTSSGTMSLECCLAGIPGAIVYRANPITYFVGRALVKIGYLGIANIILNRPAWREFIQFDAKPSKIADHLRKCLEPEAAKEAAENARLLKDSLRSPENVSASDWLVAEFDS